MSEHTFLVAVRYKDGTKQKFHVERVPDDHATVRQIVARELKHQAQSILIRTDPIAISNQEQAA